MTRERGTCALCANQGSLEKSHVTPKFAVEYLKRTSATGYIRQLVNPNLRKQDVEKTRLLCSGCEARISRWEKAFSERLFYRIVEGRWDDLAYGDWFLPFAVSLAWRHIVSQPRDARCCNVQLAPRVDDACEAWAAFLRGETSEPGPYEHHVLLLSLVEDASLPLPRGIQWYIMRSMDATLVCGDRLVASYVKLPGMVFWSAIEPPRAIGWKNTLIMHHGAIALPQTADTNVLQFLLQRASLIQGSRAVLSRKQVDVMTRSMLADEHRTAHSHSFQTYSAEGTLKERQAKRGIRAPGDDP